MQEIGPLIPIFRWVAEPSKIFQIPLFCCQIVGLPANLLGLLILRDQAQLGLHEKKYFSGPVLKLVY